MRHVSDATAITRGTRPRETASPARDGAVANHGVLDPDAGRRHFTLIRRRPHPALAARVARHWTVRWDLRGRPPFTQEVLPHPCVNVAFQAGRGGVFGMVSGRDARSLSGVGEVFGTKFRPGAFAAYSRLSAIDVVGRTTTLAEAFGPDGARLERQVLGLPEVEHYATVERFLLDRLPDTDPAFDLVSGVVDEMLRCPPDARIDALAAAHGVSVRSLQRAFRALVGVAPKWVLQRYRMHEGAERIATGEVEDLTALALDLGFFDLAHFTRQFSAAMGEPPTHYARRCAAARKHIETA